MERTRVFIIQRVFSHYRKPVYDRLSEEFEIKLLHTNMASTIKQAYAPYAVKRKGFKFYKKETTIYIPVVRDIFQFRPDVVIHEYNPSIPSIYLLFILKSILGFKIILWGHGINSQKIYQEKKLSIYIRLLLARAADAVLLYGKRTVSHFEKTIPAKKIFIAYNTLETDKYGSLKKDFEKIGQQKIKKVLGIQTTKNIVFVGRLLHTKIYPKQFVQIISEVNKSIKDLGVHIIGDGPAMDELVAETRKYDISNIYFHGEMYGENVCKYLFISDILLNPGYLGLSIVHSFCFGTPVVSFKEGKNGPHHSPEVEYIENMRTGFLAKNNDCKSLSSFIVKYFEDKNLQDQMKLNASDVVYSKYSKEQMVGGFKKAIEYVQREAQ